MIESVLLVVSIYTGNSNASIITIDNIPTNQECHNLAKIIKDTTYNVRIDGATTTTSYSYACISHNIKAVK